MGFTTVPDALRGAAKDGQDAVQQLRGADCGTPVHAVTAALPGSAAAGAAAAFADSWAATFTELCGGADEHVAALAKAADAYQAADDHTQSSLPAPPMRGPR